jgi:hypothetical protein
MTTKPVSKSKPKTPLLDPLTYSIEEAAARFPMSRTQFYEERKAGRIVPTVASAKRFNRRYIDELAASRRDGPAPGHRQLVSEGIVCVGYGQLSIVQARFGHSACEFDASAILLSPFKRRPVGHPVYGYV